MFLLEWAIEGILLDDKQTKNTKIYTVAGKIIDTPFYVLRHVLINGDNKRDFYGFVENL